jgi:hypothetical protein
MPVVLFAVAPAPVAWGTSAGQASAYEEKGDRLVPEEKLTVEETFASVRDAAAVRKLVIETFGLKRDD